MTGLLDFLSPSLARDEGGLHPVARVILAPGVVQAGFPVSRLEGRHLPGGQRVEQGRGCGVGAGKAGLAPFGRVAAIELERQRLEGVEDFLLVDFHHVVDVALGQILDAETAHAAAAVAALDRLAAAGGEQRTGQQAGEQGGGAVHEEQLTSIFLAQSGGSAA